MVTLKHIATTLAIMGTGALALTGCNKDKPTTEVPTGDDAMGGDAGDAAGDAGGEAPAEGGGEAPAEGGGEAPAEGGEAPAEGGG